MQLIGRIEPEALPCWDDVRKLLRDVVVVVVVVVHPPIYFWGRWQ